MLRHAHSPAIARSTIGQSNPLALSRNTRASAGTGSEAQRPMTRSRLGTHAPPMPLKPFIDSSLSRPILARMLRLLISALCALALAFAPAMANAAIAQTNGMPGCTMVGRMACKSADHSKKDCCTPACQSLSGVALLSSRSLDTAERGRPTVFVGATAKELAAAPSSGLDPPPRA